MDLWVAPTDAHHEMDVAGEREAMFAWVTASFARGDQPAALRAMTPDIEVVVPGSTPFAGIYRGGVEVHRWLVAMSRAFVPRGGRTSSPTRATTWSSTSGPGSAAGSG